MLFKYKLELTKIFVTNEHKLHIKWCKHTGNFPPTFLTKFPENVKTRSWVFVVKCQQIAYMNQNTCSLVQDKYKLMHWPFGDHDLWNHYAST